ncbi:rhodanese-like domain-containing protein [Neobacillus sp. FSL H8-0543]|uniref:rhodanese-like domain-containing protein n=1 Tax=Neobacillus sp. FSL H8-0543 TaxID=2954672 RepID=UPI0031590A3D
MKKILAIIAIFLLAGCTRGSFENVSSEKAKEMIDQGDVIVLDVRNLDEYNSGHIPESELLPLPEIEGMSEELDKDKSYLVVCRSGNRSQQAADILLEKGFKKIYNMTGGMNEWSYEIEN